jgi:hypothetical protein
MIQEDQSIITFMKLSSTHLQRRLRDFKHKYYEDDPLLVIQPAKCFI